MPCLDPLAKASGIESKQVLRVAFGWAGLALSTARSTSEFVRSYYPARETCRAKRIASAISVKVGAAQPLVGKTELPAT